MKAFLLSITVVTLACHSNNVPGGPLPDAETVGTEAWSQGDDRLEAGAPDAPAIEETVEDDAPRDAAGSEDGGDDECPVAVIEITPGYQAIPLTLLTLNGEHSHAASGSIATYQWEVEQPLLSVSSFVPDATYPSPVFEANVTGKYVFRLKVWDAHGHESCFPAERVVFVAPEQAIHIELLWDSPGDPNPYDEGEAVGTDLDLHFAHPKASQSDLDGDGKPDPWFDPTWDCFWFYPQQNWGSVSGVADNPILGRDDVDSGGPETIDLAEPEDVTYAIGVNYWDDHGYGPVFATVRVYRYAKLVYEVSNVELVKHDLWWVADLQWPEGLVTTKRNPRGGFWITHDYHHPLFYQP